MYFFCADKGGLTMDYRVVKVQLEKAYEMIKDYKYALVYMISDIYLCEVEQLPVIDWEECLEAYFFSKTKMLHVFEYDGRLKAVEVEDENPEHISLKKYVLHPEVFEFVTETISFFSH